jgi:SAM-dependent methyltransferase/methyltransferase-like protein
MRPAAAPGAAPGGDYNALPYTSMPYAYTQPAHLAAIVALFGLEAPAPDGARVLELGSASGGNIIPLAARFPNASFLGIDLAQRHVDEGRKRIAALGLTNIQIRQGDLAQLSFADEHFDYVICHGVFSWVPTVVQDALLRICAETLAKNGVAIVSYNVFPGWHMRKIVRDLCLHHVGRDDPPRQRVARARLLLEQLAASVSASEPYGHLLRTEAARAARRPASYILGEFLATHNEPCYFGEFAARAGQYGLSYLCEGDLNSSIPQIQSAKVRRRSKIIAGSDPLAREQYIDFFTGRTFRRSILIKAHRAISVQRSRNLEALRPLHVASELQLDESLSSKTVSVFKQRQGPSIRVERPPVCRALMRLAHAYPATLSMGQLTEGSEQEQDRVERKIFDMVVAGQATISVVPLGVGRAASERPRVSLLARTEAAEGQPWVTSLQHAPVVVQPIMAVLLPYLDGTNDREKLTLVLSEALSRGEVRVPEFHDGLEAGGNTQLQSVSLQYIERAIGYLARHALLEPS